VLGHDFLPSVRGDAGVTDVAEGVTEFRDARWDAKWDGPRMRHTTTPDRILDELRAIHLFRDCTDSELEWVDGLASVVNVEAGRPLVRRGQFGHDAIVIMSGRANVIIGKRAIASVGPGEIVGELSALDPTLPRSATVVAATPVRALVLAPGALQALLEIRSVKAGVVQTLVSRLRVADLALTP
jgi:CRP/FNR family cyclic AMP-dependent transcriptional regulator